MIRWFAELFINKILWDTFVWFISDGSLSRFRRHFKVWTLKNFLRSTKFCGIVEKLLKNYYEIRKRLHDINQYSFVFPWLFMLNVIDTIGNQDKNAVPWVLWTFWVLVKGLSILWECKSQCLNIWGWGLSKIRWSNWIK